MSEPSASGAKPAATAAALPPEEPPGTRLAVVRVAGGTEGRVLGRGAHGELVEVGLADDRPRRRRRGAATTVASYGGRQPSRIRDEQVVGHAARAEVVLERDRARRPAVRGPRRAAIRSSIAAAAARASSASTRLKAWISASRAATRARWDVDHGHGRGRARAHSVRDRDHGRRLAGGVGRRLTAPRPGSAARGSARPRRAGAAASTSSRSSVGPTTSSRSTLRSGRGAYMGTTSARSSASMSCEVLEHGAQLLGVAVELVVGELEPGQAGDVGDVGGGDGFGHGSTMLGGTPSSHSGQSRPRSGGRLGSARSVAFRARIGVDGDGISSQRCAVVIGKAAPASRSCSPLSSRCSGSSARSDVAGSTTSARRRRARAPRRSCLDPSTSGSSTHRRPRPPPRRRRARRRAPRRPTRRDRTARPRPRRIRLRPRRRDRRQPRPRRHHPRRRAPAVDGGSSRRSGTGSPGRTRPTRRPR